MPNNLFVWDDYGPEGYLNAAFFVTTPDGKTTLLRPKEKQWLRTPVPHPVEINAQNAYHLPGQRDAPNHKSLRELGVDTSTPGIYTITGLYEESATTTATPDGKKISLWGGSIASNTVKVEVKK